MAFLQKTLSSGQCRHVLRNVFTFMEELMWSELLLKKDFTTLGAARLSQDLMAVERLALDSGADLGKLHQGVLLLNLPLVADEDSATTLMEASAAIYNAAPQANEILNRLRLDQISRKDARDIMARRVEASE